MDLTQEQINSQKLPLRKKFIKIELLNADLQVIDSLEGVALDGNISRNADNTIRGSGNISLSVAIDKSKTTFLDQINYMTINYNGKIWLDKRLKIYVGIERNGEIIWNKMGVYLMDKPLRDFSATQYSISFNIVDQMVLLTGERQGQLTGLGVEIPQFTDATNWDDGLFYAKEDATFGVNTIDVANNEIISESCYYEGISGNIYVATLASDNRTVAFYTKYNNGRTLTQRSIGLPSQLDNIDIVSIHYVPNATLNNFLALGSNGYLYIMTDEFNSLSATLTFESSIQITNIASPSLVYSVTSYYVATDNGYIYFIDKSTSAITRILIGTIVKLKTMSSVLFYLKDDGVDRTIGAINLSNLTQITNLPFQSFEDIVDFDTTSITLTLIREAQLGGYKLYSYSTSNGGLTFLSLPMKTPLQDMSSISYLKGPYSTQNYFITLDSAEKQFYLYKIGDVVVEQINSFKVSLLDVNYFDINFIEFLNALKEPAGEQDLSPYLIIFGVGTATSISTTFFTVGYQVTSSLTNIPQRTYNALSQVLSSLSIIKKFTIHPIEGDFEYLPYSIKVGTSATVWDIINKFMGILSTWQAYFDLDGVLRIEPIPSGATSIVYPLSSEVYISDQNDYDFNNAKNQVVVYGKANEASFVATKVALNATNKTLTLDFDTINTDALSLKTTKFAFETGNMAPNVNIEKIILQSGAQWEQSTSTFTYSYPTTMQNLDNAWYVLSSSVYRSTDGENWANVYNYRINKIISNGSIYVGLGNQNIYYSEDNGLTWVQATVSGSLPSGAHYLDVDYGGGTFMASFTNTQNGFATSSDGKNWTIDGTLAIYSSWDKMKYANGLWVGITKSAGANDGIYTYNGTQWGAFSTPNNDYVCVDYINNKWFVGGDTTGIYTSTDGSTWTHIDSIENITPYSFAYGNGIYVAAVHNYYSGIYTSLLYSTDGTTWYRSPTFIDNSIDVVIFNGSAFIASGEDGIYYSTDGINWTQIYNSNRNNVPIAVSSNEIKIFDLNNSLNYVYSLLNPEKRTQITASFVAFENSQSYVSSNEFSEKDVYIVRFIEGSVDANNVIITTQPLTMEYYSRLQPRWCLVDENTDSPFYVNRTLSGENYYAGTALNDSNATYALRLKEFSGASLNDGTLITFMANKNNTKNPTISVYNEDGSTQLVSEAPIVGPELYTYGTNTRVRGDFAANILSNDYSIHLIKYIASINSFEYLGISPSVYSLVLSGGEYDNIHADRLAYERCLWELYSHTNLQDNLTLGIVPDYALDVNMKIPYDPANSVPIGMSRPSEQQYFLTKQISYPLAASASPQIVKAIRIYDDGGLLG